ncbi:hypothetical protein IV102_02000 [bacterium]|nr:hypothetical protein [bacterium]
MRNDTALSGLLYMRQRYYDPQLGRFLSADPIGFEGGLNLFGYVNQNPANYVDPSGLDYGGPQLGASGIYQDGPSSYHNYGPGPGNAKEIATWVTKGILPPAPPAPPEAPPGADGGPRGGFGGAGGGGPADPCPPGSPGEVPPAPPGVNILANMAKAKRIHNHKWLYKMVRLGGPWDFKQRGAPGQYEKFGNFHFGAVGHAFGCSDQVLLRGAGWAQTKSGNRGSGGAPLGDPPYGDDMKDQIQILRGIRWARNHGY